MTTREFKIIAGPSREELFDCLRLRHEGRLATFTASLPPPIISQSEHARVINRTFDSMVDSITRKFTRHGGAWIIKLTDLEASLGSTHLEGYYDTRTRNGVLMHQ